MPSCVSCGAAVQLDDLPRFARCSCGTAVPLTVEPAGVDRDLETIVGRLKRLEETLAADRDRLRASYTQLEDIATRCGR